MWVAALEVAGGEYGDHTDALVRAIDNGRSDLWTSTSTARARGGAGCAADAEGGDGGLGGALSRQSSLSLTPPSLASASESAVCRPGRMVRLYPTTFWMQLYVLMKRTFVKGLRDRVSTGRRATGRAIRSPSLLNVQKGSEKKFHQNQIRCSGDRKANPGIQGRKKN